MTDPTLITEGFHHVTFVARDSGASIAFYRDLLGFDLVAQPDAASLVFGNAQGQPGTLLAVQTRPDLNRGAPGVGGVHHVALRVTDEDQQLKWKRRLTDAGFPVSGPYDRGWFTSIYFTDPDGQILEIATEGPGFDIDEPLDALGQTLIQPNPRRLIGGRDEATIRASTHPDPVNDIDNDMRLLGIHHVTGFTDDLAAAGSFYEQALGLRLVKQSVNQDDPDTLHYFWANYDGTRVLPASDMTLFGWPTGARRTRPGVGQLDHVAFRARDAAQLAAWREHLTAQHLNPSPIEDSGPYQSLTFQAPDGMLHELATDTPGYTAAN